MSKAKHDFTPAELSTITSCRIWFSATTIIEGINKAPEQKILLAAFNKKIAEEAMGRHRLQGLRGHPQAVVLGRSLLAVGATMQTDISNLREDTIVARAACDHGELILFHNAIDRYVVALGSPRQGVACVHEALDASSQPVARVLGEVSYSDGRLAKAYSRAMLMFTSELLARTDFDE